MGKQEQETRVEYRPTEKHAHISAFRPLNSTTSHECLYQSLCSMENPYCPIEDRPNAVSATALAQNVPTPAVVVGAVVPPGQTL